MIRCATCGKEVTARRATRYCSLTCIRVRQPMRGESHYNARLTAERVREIRRRVESGEKQRAVAEDFKITPEAVSRICNHIAWKHVV